MRTTLQIILDSTANNAYNRFQKLSNQPNFARYNMNAATDECRGKTNLVKTTKTHNDFNYVKVKLRVYFNNDRLQKNCSNGF